MLCGLMEFLHVAAEIYYQNSCQIQSRFSGVHLVLEVFQKGDSRLAISYLALPVCISFLRCFRQKWRTSVSVCKKMLLLMCSNVSYHPHTYTDTESQLQPG